MYDNDILMGLDEHIGYYKGSPVSYVKSIFYNEFLTLEQKINALTYIVSTPITASTSFESLSDNEKYLWLTLAYIYSTGFIVNNISDTTFYEYERLEILSNLIYHLIKCYSYSEHHGNTNSLPPPHLQVTMAMEKLKELCENDTPMLTFPSHFFIKYPQQVKYLIENFEFITYGTQHKTIMSIISNVDIDTSLWENGYLKAVNRIKLLNLTDTIEYRMIYL